MKGMIEMEGLLNANDISCKLGISRSSAYNVIRNLNQELQNEGYLVIRGKVPQRYFMKRYYLIQDEKE